MTLDQAIDDMLRDQPIVGEELHTRMVGAIRQALARWPKRAVGKLLQSEEKYRLRRLVAERMDVAGHPKVPPLLLLFASVVIWLIEHWLTSRWADVTEQAASTEFRRIVEEARST